MGYYQSNPGLGYGRCSTRGLMGPAVLVTLGLLFLLANTSDYPFERTWPILLIVIGAIKVARYVISESGHSNPGQLPPPPYGGQSHPPPYPAEYAPGAQNTVPATGSVVAPPPASGAEVQGEGRGENNEVQNG